MGEDRTGRPSGELRALRQNLAEARDGQIARVVAMVDAMPERGEADRLIEPLRFRLARMGVDRPLNFTRLLFLPLDPVIVPAAHWRRGVPALPRSALPRLGAMVLDALALSPAEVEDVLGEASMRQPARAVQAGRAVWGAAAGVLGQAAPPADWTEATGLAAQDFSALAPACAAVLRNAAPLHAMLLEISLGGEPDEALLGAMLREASAVGPFPFALLVAVLMARVPGCAAVVTLADELGASGPARAAADGAVAFVLERMAVAGEAPLDKATATLRADAALLLGLEARSAQRPSRLAQVQQARRRLDGQCQARFAAELPARVLEPGAALAGASDAQIDSLEAGARDLRRFGQTAGALGHPERYERSLREAAQALRPRADDPPETLADRVRLTEILAGPEAALALLG